MSYIAVLQLCFASQPSLLDHQIWPNDQQHFAEMADLYRQTESSSTRIRAFSKFLHGKKKER